MDAAGATVHPHAAELRQQLARILSSATFRDAQRSCQLLRYIVEAVLEGRGGTLKEYTLGAEALDRGANFDPRSDAIARVEASRLRSRLTQFYATEGSHDPWVITLPKGTYVPEFTPAPERPETVAAPLLRDGPSRYWPLIAIGVAALAAVGLMLWDDRKGTPLSAPTGAATLVRVDPGAAVEVASEVGNDLALSADGRMLVFVGRDALGRYALFARDLASLVARELPGTGGARVPALSADGAWVVFWAEGELRKTRADGTGRPVSVMRAQDVLGIDWIDDSHLLAAISPFELVRVDLGNGETTPLFSTKSGRRLIFPQSLHQGRFVLATSDEGQVGNAVIDLLDLKSGERTTLVRGALYGRYVDSGHLLFVRAGTLYAVKLNLEARKVEGDPIPLLEGISWSPTFAYAQYAVANSGLLLALRGGDGAETRVGWIADGKAPEMLALSGLLQWPRLSPDGNQLAVMRRDAADYDLWLYDMPRGTGRKLVDLPQDLQSPVWSPNGQWLLFSARSGNIYWARQGKTGVVLKSGADQQILVPTSISPDGKWLAYHARGVGRPSFDLWVAPLHEGPQGPEAGEPAIYRSTDSFETYARFSPDGHWISYASNESGRWEIYVRAFPDDGRSVLVSKSGGRQPLWDPRGGMLYFATEDRGIVAATYAVRQGQFTVQGQRELPGVRLADTGVIGSYDASVKGGVLGLLPLQTQPAALLMLTDFKQRLVAPNRQ